jgi:hypothetical protein
MIGALVAVANAALAAPANRVAAVENGVLRWQDDHSEVALFGVNYYPPFCIDYQLIKARGLDHEKAIRDDVAHFERLGLTAIRLHCWDREISDHDGNLRDNDHLRLLDYLINECQKRGIYAVMTPIAWWQTTDGGGFSDLYTMPQMISDLKARTAQCNYLTQYLNHVNRYTGKAFKDDPAIVALELINEPIPAPGTTDAQLTEYIDALCKAVRDTGCKKPIFFNCWGNRAGAAAASTLDGVTFGWYPTGLVNGMMLKANFLRGIQDYPSMRDPKLARLAKIVYEFDAADVHQTVMYPTMARAFRRGGAQSATQFQYDPMCIAEGNANWQTHFLNLCYTPGKALSFAIGAEVMRRAERGNPNADVPGLRVSYEENLSELASGDTFLYSNDTKTMPADSAKLTRIAGVGSSPVVGYGGTGAYFLDRLAPGVWKLQVYPDAVMVADPYSGGTNEKVRILWGKWPMQVHLPDLGSDFRVLKANGATPADTGVTARDGSFDATPGEYALTASGKSAPTTLPGVGFVCPPSSTAAPAAFIDAPATWREGKPYRVTTNVAAMGVSQCTLRFRPAGAKAFEDLPMKRDTAYTWSAQAPVRLLASGQASYYLAVKTADGPYCLPKGAETSAAESEPTRLALLGIKPDGELPKVDYGGPAGMGARVKWVAGRDAGATALQLDADGFGAEPSCAGTGLKVAASAPAGEPPNVVTFIARGGRYTTCVEVSLVQKDGNAFGANVPLSQAWGEITLPVDRLRPMWSTKATNPDLTQLDHITIVTGAWILGDLSPRHHTVEIQNVFLSRQPNLWSVQVVPADAPVLLCEPAVRPFSSQGRPATIAVVPGMDPGKMAVRISVPAFGPPPDATSIRQQVAAQVEPCAEQAAKAKFVVIKARAGEPTTKRFELVLVEADGSPWGTMEVPLTEEWQELRIPITGLRFFSHWLPDVKDRGGPGDRLRPEKTEAVNICFGSWLYPDDYAKPQAIEIQSIGLAEE